VHVLALLPMPTPSEPSRKNQRNAMGVRWNAKRIQFVKKSTNSLYYKLQPFAKEIKIRTMLAQEFEGFGFAMDDEITRFSCRTMNAADRIRKKCCSYTTIMQQYCSILHKYNLINVFEGPHSL
jgi:hypothetical protein